MATPRAIPVGVRAVVVCLTPLLLLLLVPAGPAVAAPLTHRTPTLGAAATEPLDTTDRGAVAAAYRDVYLPAAAVSAPAPAADAVSRCAAGTSPGTLQNATLDLVNYLRQLSGVDPVSWDTSLAGTAQLVALMMYANSTVSTVAPPNGKCPTDSGVTPFIKASLSGSATGAAVVRQYMDDSGDDHATVPRRSRLQQPNVRYVGSGAVGSSNALYSRQQGSGGPDYTSWPSSGYFPAPLEPAGRWSVTPWNPDNDLRRAAVSVTGPDSRPVSVTTHGVASASSPLVFEVGTLPVPTGSRVDTYTVTVSNITNKWGDTLDDYTYPVRLFDPAGDVPPAPVQVTAVTAPTVTGAARVGSVLTASGPSWTPAGVTTSYQWLRNGTAVAGATAATYPLTADDVGDRIAVRATGTKPDCTDGTSQSGDSATVSKAPATVGVTAGSPAPGQAHLAVSVSAAVGAVSGTIEVLEGGSPVSDSVPVVDGTSTLDLADLTPGPHTFSVAYSGDASVAAATATTTVTVADGISPGLTVSATSAAVGQLALDVDVRAGGQPAAGGTVAVQEGTTTLQSGIAVSDGSARYQGTRLAPGRHTLTVRYSGTTRVKASSTTITTTVKAKAKPVLTLRSSSAAKGKVKITVTVTAAGQQNLGGSVMIKEGSKIRKAKVVVRRGKASWAASKIKKGKHTYTVVYSGTSQVAGRSAKTAVKVR